MKQARVAWSQMHWPLVAVAMLIAMAGVYNLHSSAAARDPGLYFVQLVVLGVGVLGLGALLAVDYRVTESLAFPGYAIACLFLVAVLFHGETTKGAQRWLSVGLLTFQPSELAKLAVILCLARYFSQRAEPGGYTMRSLFRPLNLSRPLAALGLLVWAWTKPLLSDPVGELARAVRAQVGGAPPQLGDLLWFRLLLLAGALALAAGGVLLINQSARQRALLDPWPPGRRATFMLLWCLIMAGVAALLAYVWNAPLLRDPFGALIASLAREAGPNGSYATLNAGYGLRVALSLSGVAYLAAAVWYARRSTDPLVDLLVAPIDLVLFPATLVLVQPDLGTAGIIMLIGLTVIFVVGIRLRTLIIMSLMGAGMAVVGWFGILKDYQKLRILMLIDPDQDRKGAGWNVVQSLIAVGSGRWTGKGHLEGTQSQLAFLPEQHTDFAFSVWAEEQGFLGCLFVLALYAAFLLMALAIAAEARDGYGALLATGVVALVFWQTVINVGMVVGLLPVVGLTLPLFSYGGSSLLTVMLGCGLLLSVRQHRRAY